MNNSHSNLVTRYTQVIAGIQKNLATAINLVFVGVTYSGADLVKLFQSWLVAAAAVTATKAQWQAAVLAERALAKTVQAVWIELRGYARNQYAATPAVLGDFGYSPAKVAVKDPEALVTAAAKAKATRAARHTLGKNQKKDITGATFAPVVPAPATVPVAKSS